MKTFKRDIHRHFYYDYEVKANNKEEAIKKVNDGDWTDEDIVSSELVIRETTGDVEEVFDEN